MQHSAMRKAQRRLAAMAKAATGESAAVKRRGKAAAESNEALSAWQNLANLRQSLHAAGKTASIDEIIGWKNEGRP